MNYKLAHTFIENNVSFPTKFNISFCTFHNTVIKHKIKQKLAMVHFHSTAVHSNAGKFFRPKMFDVYEKFGDDSIKKNKK